MCGSDGAGARLQSGQGSDRRRSPGLGHRCRSGGKGTPAGKRNRTARRGSVCAKVRPMPRVNRDREPVGSSSGGRPRHAQEPSGCEDDWEFLAVRHNHLGLYLPRNAQRPRGISRSRRGVLSDGLSALQERHHPGQRGNGFQELAEGPNAESGWIHSFTDRGYAPLALPRRNLPLKDCSRGTSELTCRKR